MPNTINGIAEPAFSVTELNGSRASFLFPLCGIGGCNPRYLPDTNLTELGSGKLEQDVFGYRAKYILDYSQRLEAEYCDQLIYMLNARMRGATVKFMAHVDEESINEEVIFTNTEFIFNLLASAGTFVSMQGIIIELLAVNTGIIPSIFTFEPGDPIQFTFDDFITI